MSHSSLTKILQNPAVTDAQLAAAIEHLGDEPIHNDLLRSILVRWTAAHDAHPYPRTLQLLAANRSIDPNAKILGTPMLHIASKSPDALHAFLTAPFTTPIDLNKLSDSLNTALHIAAESSDEAYQMLIAAGAKPGSRNVDGFTADELRHR